METREGHDVYVALTDGQSVKQRTFHEQVIFDLDAENNIVGVEIVAARSATVDGEDACAQDAELGDLTVALGNAQDAWHDGDPADDIDLNRSVAGSLLAHYKITLREQVSE